MHYVFDTLPAALACIHAIDEAMSWPSADGTETYAIPREHPDGGAWAVPAGAGGVATEAMRAAGVFTADAPQFLSADWWPALA